MAMFRPARDDSRVLVQLDGPRRVLCVRGGPALPGAGCLGPGGAGRSGAGHLLVPGSLLGMAGSTGAHDGSNDGTTDRGGIILHAWYYNTTIADSLDLLWEPCDLEHFAPLSANKHLIMCC